MKLWTASEGEGLNLKKHQTSKYLVQCALTVAIIMVFFTIFRGITNLLNAFLVPMALYTGMKGTNRLQAMTLFSVTLICGLLFFSVQLFFLSLYCMLAWQLQYLMKKGSSVIKTAIYLAGISAAGFYGAIRLTDLVFLTRMHTIFMGLFNGNWILYGVMILAEGLIAGFGLAYGAAAVERRIGTA